MNQAVDFGPRLSGEEYERRVVALYSGAPPLPDEDQVGVGSLIRYALGRLMPSFLVRHARTLAEETVRAYAKVLSEEELRQFLDLEAGKPVWWMPVDTR